MFLAIHRKEITELVQTHSQNKIAHCRIKYYKRAAELKESAE